MQLCVFVCVQLSELQARVARFEQDKLFPRNVLDSLIDEVSQPSRHIFS